MPSRLDQNGCGVDTPNRKACPSHEQLERIPEGRHTHERNARARQKPQFQQPSAKRSDATNAFNRN